MMWTEKLQNLADLEPYEAIERLREFVPDLYLALTIAPKVEQDLLRLAGSVDQTKPPAAND
jgi:hypothetical protein